MLLNIYLGTTAISFATAFIFGAAWEEKLKRDGYKFVKEKESLPEKIANLMSNNYMYFIPVYNILITIFLLGMGDKMYEYAKEKLLKSGKIYKPITEELNNDYKSEEKDDSYTASIQKTKTEKTYDEMTTEEKIAYLQQEKEKLINQTTPQAEKALTLNKRRK